MEANQLMIGDWVKHFNGTPMQVTRIDYTQSGGHFACGTPHCWEYNNKFEPIPLTDAILRANGFEYRHKNFAALSYEHPFQLEMVKWPDENGIGLWMVSGLLKIRYVHELQHAMRLCDIDKVISIKDD